MNIGESIVVAMDHRPAWSFADNAVKWRQEVANSPGPYHVGEPALLTFLYSCLSLEAVIAEFLDASPPDAAIDDLLGDSVGILRRWREGTHRLCIGSATSTAAAGRIRASCESEGEYGLLVRSRNKLIHPRVHTEIIDDSGHSIRDGKLENLVASLRKPPLGLPDIRPAFPNIVKCQASSEWALRTLKQMIGDLHVAAVVDLSDDWQSVLARV